MLFGSMSYTTGFAGLNLETGQLCLDFANTADWHASAHPEEELNSYADLVSWAQQVELVNAAEAARLINAAGRRPAEAAAVLERAVELREAIYHLFSTRAQGLPPEAHHLAALNAALEAALPHLRLAPSAPHFSWEWTDREVGLDALLWPVTLSAALLLTSEDLDRVGECADDRGCGYLFFDTSRNHSRRWCEMRDCGNRAKARRHYRRIKTA